jgi:uncharacterized protein YegP (UPF0339 family)
MADETRQTRVTVDLTFAVDDTELSTGTDALEEAVAELVGPGTTGELRVTVDRSDGESPATDAAADRAVAPGGTELDAPDADPVEEGEPGSGVDESGDATPGPAPADPPAGPAKARFEVYEDRGGQFRWRLVHDNGNVIADSGEGYATWAGAENGLQSVKRNAADATVRRL